MNSGFALSNDFDSLSLWTSILIGLPEADAALCRCVRSSFFPEDTFRTAQRAAEHSCREGPEANRLAKNESSGSQEARMSDSSGGQTDLQPSGSTPSYPLEPFLTLELMHFNVYIMRHDSER